MNRRPEYRVEKIVSDLLRGRRLKLRAGDSDDKEAITVAARLAGARQGPQRMRPEFRRRLQRELDAAPAEGWMTRRAALVAGLGLAAGAAGGALLGRATQPATPKTAGADPIEPFHAVWTDVGSIDELVEGQGKRVTAGGVSAFVFRHRDRVTAVSAVCSHLPCDLWWDGNDAHLVCPCHPARFMADGQPLGSYGLPALHPVHVRVTPAGRLEVMGT